LRLAEVGCLVLGVVLETVALMLEHRRKIARRLEFASIGCFLLLGVAEWQMYVLELPRHLSEVDKTSITQCLSPGAGQDLYLSNPPEKESQDYADDFTDIIQAAGWKLYLLSGLRVPADIEVMIDKRDDLPGNVTKGNADRLGQCLHERRISSTLVTSQDKNQALVGFIVLILPSHP
jgi:hypothetical protein